MFGNQIGIQIGVQIGILNSFLNLSQLKVVIIFIAINLLQKFCFEKKKSFQAGTRAQVVSTQMFCHLNYSDDTQPRFRHSYALSKLHTVEYLHEVLCGKRERKIIPASMK